MKKLLLRHIYSLSVKGFSVIISFLLAKVYIDKISTAEFGLFTLNYGYIVLFATIIGTGPGLLVISKLHDNEQINPTFYILINICISILIWFLVQIFISLEFTLLYTIIITAIAFYFNETMRANSSGNIYILMKDIIRAAASVLLIFLNFKKANDILLYSSLINLFFIIIYAVFAKKKIYFSLKNGSNSIKNYYASFSISMSSGLQAIRGWIEIYLSGMFLSLHDVGLFSVLQKLAKLISLPLNALNADIAKNVIQSIKEKKVSDKLKKQLLLTRITALIFSIICIAGLSYFLKIYKYPSNVSNMTVGILLILTNLANVIFGPVGLISQLSNLRDFFLFSTIISIIITGVLSWIFLPLYGILALSTINFLTMIIWNALLYYKIKTTTQISL